MVSGSKLAVLTDTESRVWTPLLTSTERREEIQNESVYTVVLLKVIVKNLRNNLKTKKIL